MFETECRTTYKEKQTKSQHPKTACKRIPKTLCGSQDCVFVEEEEHCHNKTNAVVKEVPEETCDIIPNKICKNVNKLVPFLDPVSECKNVPKEKCSFGVKSDLGDRTLTTKWCYDPETSEGRKNIKFPGISSLDIRKGRVSSEIYQPTSDKRGRRLLKSDFQQQKMNHITMMKDIL